MSELPVDCARFRDLIEEHIVDEAPARDVAWMRQHTRTCEICAAWQGGLALVSSDAEVPSLGQSRIDAIVDQAHSSQGPRWLYAVAVIVVVAGATVAAAVLLHRPAALVVVYGEVKADEVMSATAVIAVNERLEATLTRGTRFAVAPSRSHHTELRLQQGSARFSVRHRAGDEVIVATPQCDVIDEGTVFTVDAMADGTRIAVIEGAVEVKPRAPVGRRSTSALV